MESIFELLAQYRTIETERLLLRPVTLTDAEEMFVYASDIENLRFTFPVNETIEVTKKNIAEIYLNSPLGRYGIVLKDESRLIGTIDFHHWNISVKRAEIGYCLNKSYWNNGYATEALKALVDLAFNQLGLNCLVAKHDKENIASGSVMKKSGFAFSHEEPYAKLDSKNPSRIVTLCHYYYTKEKYFKS